MYADTHLLVIFKSLADVINHSNTVAQGRRRSQHTLMQKHALPAGKCVYFNVSKTKCAVKCVCARGRKHIYLSDSAQAILTV